MEETTIGEAFNLKSGKQLSKSKMIPGEHPVFGGNGISGYHNEYMFKKPKIVIGRVGAYCGNVQRTKPYSWITDNALYIDEKLHEYDESYLEYLLRSLDLKQYSSQSGQPLISQGRINNVKIPLPNLSEQKTIVAKLDRAQRLIDIDKEMLAKYDELIQSVFLEMFGDPVTNPKGWEVKKLGSMIKLIGGGTPSRKNENYWGGDIMWATVKDLKGDILFRTQETITNDGLESSSSKIIPAGNIIICSRMNVGKVMMNSIDVAINQDLKGVFLNDGYDKEYIFYFLKTQKKYFEDVSSGATVKGIKIGHIKNLKTTVPDSKTLIKFKESISAIRDLRQNYKSSLKQSEELFSSLVQGVFG